MYQRLSASENWVPLLLRIGVGLTFFLAGLGKVMGGVGGFAGFLGSLGVPMAGVAGPFVAYLELFGGLLLLAGLLVRPISALLVFNMLVAMLLVTVPGWLGAENGLAGGFGQTLRRAAAGAIVRGAGAHRCRSILAGCRSVRPALPGRTQCARQPSALRKTIERSSAETPRTQRIKEFAASSASLRCRLCGLRYSTIGFQRYAAAVGPVE